MSEHTISKFLKSKGKLTIIVDKGCLYSGNYSKKLNISKISFKIAKIANGKIGISIITMEMDLNTEIHLMPKLKGR